MTTADVYRWLDDEGLFPRSAVCNPPKFRQDVKVDNIAPAPDVFCASCGLNRLLHPFAPQTESSVDGFSCDVAPKQILQKPVLDITRLLAKSSAPDTRLGLSSYSSPGSWLSPDDLVAVSDPGFIAAIRNIIRPMKLGSFNSISEAPVREVHEYPLARLGATPEQVMEHLAPYALISVLAKIFIRILIRDGLEVARGDAKFASTGRKIEKTMLLTPSHIIRRLRPVSRKPV